MKYIGTMAPGSRALGQGFNGGLEPLAISFGVDVAQPAPQPAKPARMSLEKKLETKSPRLVSLAKKALVSLTKNKLDTLEAAVAFVLDASGSMSGQFSKGNVQSVLDRIAVLAAQFDDDGEMDVWGWEERRSIQTSHWTTWTHIFSPFAGLESVDLGEPAGTWWDKQ
ncbi:VWA domain-containing protein [Escherichia coli]